MTDRTDRRDLQLRARRTTGRGRRSSRWLLFAGALAVCAPAVVMSPSTAIAQPQGPADEARALADKGGEILKKAKRRRGKRKTAMLADGLREYARAWLLVSRHKLEKADPELARSIGAAITEANKMPEVAELRAELLEQAVTAAGEEKIEAAYEALEKVRNLDPRDPAVGYALEVIAPMADGGSR